MKKLIFALFIAILAKDANAQVGIGNVVPDTNAILDLSNTNNRGLVLPSTPGSLPTSPNGIMYWNVADNVIMYREATGYNALSPWRYKFGGSVSENVYYNFSGNVGIGEDNPQAKLHINKNGRALVLEGSSTSYLSFKPSGYNNDGGNIGFSTSTNTFKIQNERQGDIEVTFNTNGGARALNITNGKVEERGADLVPAGTIVMYYSSSAPAGWGLCNGTNYNRADGSGSIQSPDLRGRFIVAAGSGYSQGNTGGDDDIQITSSHLPEHTHTFSGTTTNIGSTHRHFTTVDDVDGGNLPKPSQGVLSITSSDPDVANFRLNNNSADGAHTHTYSGTTDDAGVSSVPVIDNRPEYYAITFIMKL